VLRNRELANSERDEGAKDREQTSGDHRADAPDLDSGIETRATEHAHDASEARERDSNLGDGEQEVVDPRSPWRRLTDRGSAAAARAPPYHRPAGGREATP
jgi:hypothetical protein